MIKNCHNYMHGCPNMTWGNATSEDCLYLNVYSPVEHSAQQHDDVGLLPVVVRPFSHSCGRVRAMTSALTAGIFSVHRSTFRAVRSNGAHQTTRKTTLTKKRRQQAGKTSCSFLQTTVLVCFPLVISAQSAALIDLRACACRNLRFLSLRVIERTIW